VEGEKETDTNLKSRRERGWVHAPYLNTGLGISSEVVG
jgi:hypothetical protein